MSYFKDNENFYPTPPELAAKMIVKVDITKIKYVLEPSAGKGDLADFIDKYYKIMQGSYGLHQWILDKCCKKTNIATREEVARLTLNDVKDYDSHRHLDIDCVEIDENLRHILKGKEYRVDGEDFLRFYTAKKYDLIFMNPPFDRGEEHLLKAIELQSRYGGEIVCLLNAETIKNPFSNMRKELAKKLAQYNAEYEYISNGFTHVSF